MDANGCKRMQTDANGCKRIQTDANGCKWMKKDANSVAQLRPHRETLLTETRSAEPPTFARESPKNEENILYSFGKNKKRQKHRNTL